MIAFTRSAWEGADMLFMVVERFRHQDAKSIYARFHEKGRLMPDELTFVGSWVSAAFFMRPRHLLRMGH